MSTVWIEMDHFLSNFASLRNRKGNLRMRKLRQSSPIMEKETILSTMNKQNLQRTYIPSNFVYFYILTPWQPTS